MRRFSATLLLALGLPAAATQPALASPGAASAASTVIVRYAPGVDAQERGDARSAAGVRRSEVLPLARTEVVDPDPGVPVVAAVRALERDPAVSYAEPNAPRVAFAAPNDPLFGLQWGLRNTGQLVNGIRGTAGDDIGALAAWGVTTGSADVVVGVIDSGADTGNPELAGNLWRNPGETGPGQATNGIDDDHNGFVDDVNGWDFAAGDAEPLDVNGHGTHVAGTIGARGGNGVGVTGVAQNASLMVLRTLGAAGSGTVADVISAYAYAARNGARVVNLSLGGPSGSRAERDALQAASGVLFVAAAGNDGADVDTAPTYPCAYDLPNVLCVAASGRDDQLASFSNHGARTVDLAAPGVDIASTYLNGEYYYLSGTSMAAPHVTGAAALVLSRTPALSVADVRNVLLTSVDPVPGLQGSTVTGGRLDVARAVGAAPATVDSGAATSTAPPPSPTASTSTTDAAPAPASAPEPSPVTQPAMQPAPASSQAATPAPPPPPATVVQGAGFADVTPPGLAVHLTPRLRTAALRAGGLRVTLSATEACRLAFSVTLDPATARRLHLTSRRVAVAARTLSRAGELTLVLRPSAALKTRLRGQGRATLRVVADDAAANRAVRVQRLLLLP